MEGSSEVVDLVPQEGFVGMGRLVTAAAAAREDISSRNAATEYLKTLGSKASRRAILCRLNHVARWFRYPDAEHCDWHLMRYEHVIDFIDHLRHIEGRTGNHQDSPHELKVSTINAYLYAIKAVARMAWSLGQMDDRNMTRITATKAVRGRDVVKGRAMTLQESAALLDQCSDEVPREIRDKAILTLLLGNGLRRAEVAGIEMRHVDLERHEIRIRGKGNKERTILLTPQVEKPLLHWMQTRTTLPAADKYQNMGESFDGDYLFCRFTRHCKALVKNRAMTPRAIWEISNRYIERASENVKSIKDISCHDFRRTFATRLFDYGVDIVTIKNLMGHSNISTTARYDKRGDEAMHKAMELVQL